MEQFDNNQTAQSQKVVPYAVASLVLGILGILTSIFCGGLLFCPLGLVFAKKCRLAFKTTTNFYKGKGILISGYILSIIGLALSIVALVCVFVCMAVGVSYFEWWIDYIRCDLELY